MRIDVSIFAFLVLAHLIGAVAGDLENAVSTPRIRRALQQRSNGARRRSKRECIVVMFEVQYEDHHHVDESLACELLDEDLNGKPYDMVRIRGIRSDWARQHNVTSGVTTIFVTSGADIDDSTSQLLIPSGSTIQLGRRDKKSIDEVAALSHTSVMDRGDAFWSRNLATVVKTVLVMRIEARDAATTLTESELANKIFGASGDKINLSSRFRDCSDGQMLMQPVTGIGTHGVYTIRLPTYNVTGVNAPTVISMARSTVTAALGTDPKNLANHVIFCLPPGTLGGRWIAYAAINYWQSAYNDLWCQYPSALMHEIGHNLGLDHAGDGADEYGDNTGMMGSAYGGDDEGPLMCFNAANTWQLGWYTDYRVDLPIMNSYVWSGSLIGLAEKNSAIASDKMMIRIRSASDYYIHFNRQIGMNNGTKEGFNKVLVTSRAPGLGPAKSTLLAKLAAKGAYALPISDENNALLTVFVNSLNLADVSARASISIMFQGPVLPPALVPTRGPAALPTRTPTSAPTASPTRTPTVPPVTALTLAPMSVFTSAPMTAPSLTSPVPVESAVAAVLTTVSVLTEVPTTALTKAPSKAPTAATTKRPTTAPTSTPTRVPTKSPTTAPTRSPTRGPTKSPTRAPTRPPTRAPTKSPTKLPTRKPTQPFCNNNGTCEPGENCVSCRNDCRGGFSGYPITSPMCCIGGSCATRCSENGWRCK